MVRPRLVRGRAQRVFGDKLQRVRRFLQRARHGGSGEEELPRVCRPVPGQGGSWRSAGSCWDMQSSVWRFFSRKFLLSSGLVNFLVSLAILGALLETLALLALFTLLEEEQEAIQHQLAAAIAPADPGAWPVEPED